MSRGPRPARKASGPTSAQQGLNRLEMGMAGIAQPLEHHRLRTHDLDRRLAKPIKRVLIILQTSRADGVFHHEYFLTPRAQIEGGLQHTDMCLHADQHDLSTREGSQRATEVRAITA